MVEEVSRLFFIPASRSSITANEEIAVARELGMQVVITDHHECHENLPDAQAVVDCKRTDDTYPFSSLAGVGVAFKLICEIGRAHV